MQKNKKFILGGGTAGLLYAFYNKDYQLITKQLGGQFSAPFPLGPKYIHVDKYSKKLFEDLKLKPKIKTVKIGFFYDQKLHKKNTTEQREKYFQKTRGISTKSYDTAQTSGKTEFQAFDIDPDTLVEELTNKIEKDRIILDTVKAIDLDKQIIKTTKNGTLQYEHLVSTIPLNVFCSLAGKQSLADSLEYRSTTFAKHTGQYKIWCELEKKIDEENFNYVYLSEDKIPFHRITKIKDGFVYEKSGPVSPNFPLETVVLPVGQIINTDQKIDFSNVTFLGRYAKWQHGILINNVLQEIYESKEKNV